MTLSKQEILAKMKSAKKAVYIKSWDAEIYLKELPAGEVLALTKQMKDGTLSNEEFTFYLIVMSVVDEAGEKVFTLDEAKGLSVAVLTELAEAVSAYNGMGTKAIEDAKEELKKTEG
jgi:hypothetical protein